MNGLSHNDSKTPLILKIEKLMHHEDQNLLVQDSGECEAKKT